MYLNKIAPAKGSKRNKIRVGRGMGSNFGKTCGRGHKGQKSRSGGFHKTGFEGGQMPIQRRLPKRGFISHKIDTVTLRSSDLTNLNEDVISRVVLIENKLISKTTKKVKIYKSSNFDKKITIDGIKVTAGMRSIIESNDGKIV